MALKNPKLFGLNVLTYLADVRNKNLSLKSLDLNILDLDIIRGSSTTDPIMTRRDFVSLSRLNQPIHKALGRFVDETSQYPSILGKKAGVDNILFGNLSINGALSGNAIRYRFVRKNPDTGVKELKIADISTSRVSAWSSSASPVISTSPISYGARVAIRDGSALQFGTPTNTNQKRLQTSIIPVKKEFDAEVPTSKITTTITLPDGTVKTVKLYAMKGIPLVFRGFFRNLNATILISQQTVDGTPIAASWKIVETGNANNFVNYADQGGAESIIAFRSSRSRERNIQFYYNPDQIRRITIQSSGIDTLPVVKLIGITHINLRYNNLKNFPDFNSLAPQNTLISLLLSRNPFYLSENSNERTLNQNIINKIPAGLKSLHLPGTFYGSIDPNLFNKFTVITDFQLGRGGGANFHPDGINADTPLPNIADTCTTYTAYNNDFRSIDASPGNDVDGNPLKNIKQLTKLSYLHLSGNYYLNDSGNFSIQSSKINYINLAATNLNIPDLAGKPELVNAYFHYMRSSGGIFTASGDYKFASCNKLETLYCYSTNLSVTGGGRFPRFSNSNLKYIEFRRTSIVGGFKNGSTEIDTFAIHPDTFKDCANLETLYIDSPNLSREGIENSVFTFTPKLKNIIYNSRGRTGSSGALPDTGKIPNFNGCSNLRYFSLYNNGFTTGTPTFNSAQNIGYVNLGYNKLTGAIPAYTNLSRLQRLYLNNNKFTTLSAFVNLPKLRYFYCHNQFTDGAPGISGQIPDFSSCPRMYYLIMYNNSFTSYESGSFESLSNLKYLDISNNQLSSTALEQIILDLYTNYTDTPRRGVTINIKNAMASGNTLEESTLENITILRSKGWTIIIQ